MLATKLKNKAYHDKKIKNPPLKPGDFVFIVNESKKHKFDKLLLGPFKVLETISDQNIIIDQNGKRKKVHRNRTKKSNSTPDDTSTPSTSTDTNDPSTSQTKPAEIKTMAIGGCPDQSISSSDSIHSMASSTTPIMELDTDVGVNALQKEIDRCEDAMMDFINTFY